MDEIVKYTGQIPARYTGAEMAVIDAQQNSTKIFSMQIDDISVELSKMLTKAYIDAGYQLPGKESMMILSGSVADDLFTYFKTLSIKEVGLAIQNGIRGEYGEFYGISVKTIHQFCKAFQDSFDRNEAMRKAKQNTENDEQKLSQAEIDKIMIPACIEAFKKYKETNELIDFGGAKYTYLKKIGLINLTPERQKTIMDQAKKEQAEESNKSIFKNGADSMAGIIAGKILKNLDKHETVKNAARLIALREYFDFLIENEFELTEMMNQ